MLAATQEAREGGTRCRSVEVGGLEESNKNGDDASIRFTMAADDDACISGGSSPPLSLDASRDDKRGRFEARRVRPRSSGLPEPILTPVLGENTGMEGRCAVAIREFGWMDPCGN